MVDIQVIDDYLNLIDMKPKQFCKEQKQLVTWLPPILDTAFLDEDKAREMIELIEFYFFPLMPFQKFLCGIIEGVNDEYKDPLFDEIFLYGGRGLGKNGFISGTAMYLTTNKHGIRDYDIDIIANSENQAMTSFNDIYDVVDNDKKLQNAFYYNKQLIRFKGTNSTIKYVTSSAKSSDGRRPGALIFDEIHAYENEDTMNVNSSGLGKVDRFRQFYITTDGYVREGVLDKMKSRALDILYKGKEHNGLFPMMFRLDDVKEASDPKMWIKANPRLEYSRTLMRAVKKHYEKALEDEGQMVEFLTKRMNVPVVDRHKAVASWEDIMKASGELPDLKGKQCIGCIDYAGNRDFCAVGLLFRDGEHAYLKHHTFIHHSSIENTKFNIPIQEAVNKGLATIIYDKPSIPPDEVLGWFIDQAKHYSILKIVADRYRVTWLKDTFNASGVELIEVPSGYITHNKLHPLISKLFTDGLITWGDDMMMRWYTNNTKVVIDNKGNHRYEKIEPIKLKTDGFMMFVHGMTEWDALGNAQRKVRLRVI